MERVRGSDTDFEIVGGAPKLCYQGHHTTKDFKGTSDMRIIFPGYIHLDADKCSNLQEQINNLPSFTHILEIASNRGIVGDFSLTRKLPNLEHLILRKVSCRRLVLTEKTTPVLSQLEAYELPKCNAVVRPPDLAILKLFGCGDQDWLFETVRHAKNLEYFDSQFLRAEKLFFCSNHLRVVDLHRALYFKELTIYAPCLEKVILQECYHAQLEKIEILDDDCCDGHQHHTDRHRRRTTTTNRDDQGSIFEVNTILADLSNAVQAYLEGHHRVRLERDVPEHIPARLMAMMGAGRDSS